MSDNEVEADQKMYIVTFAQVLEPDENDLSCESEDEALTGCYDGAIWCDGEIVCIVIDGIEYRP